MSLVHRLLQHVRLRPNEIGTMCWEWMGETDKDGYGRLTFKTRGRHFRKSAHHIAFFCFHSYWPRSGVLRHVCDNKRCASPFHLIHGTHDENMDDCLMSADTKLELASELGAGVDLDMAEDFDLFEDGQETDDDEVIEEDGYSYLDGTAMGASA